MRGANNTEETINAAATAIASVENRVPQASVQKRRWGSCWSISWCFGSHKQSKRIGHAALVPEPNPSRTEAPRVENPIQPPSIILPFVAPPSSPASFLQSEPPSATQSPTGLLAFNSVSASMYSPGGPANIFAIGPYAHETQLVSPPVFSTFTTEPSTAPFTPPPESIHLTTPSSPEVPFARLLGPPHQNGEAGQRFPSSHYEFQSYQLYPGSPMGQLISPSSGISGSGTSSPFPDGEFARAGSHFLEFPAPNLEKLSSHEWESRQGSGTLTPDAVGPKSLNSSLRSGTLTPDAVEPKSCDGFLLDRQDSDVGPLTSFSNGGRNDESMISHRVSFEITAEEVVRCVEKRLTADTANVRECRTDEASNGHENHTGETSGNTSERASVDGEDGQRHQKHRSTTLGSVKEFNFDNADGVNPDDPNIETDWWTNEKLLEKESGPIENWSFFPMMQPGVS